jgi:hypothetical protein
VFLLRWAPGPNPADTLDQVKPGFIEKLSESDYAGPTILCVGIAIGLSRNDPLDERTHRGRATKLVWLTKISIQAPSG